MEHQAGVLGHLPVTCLCSRAGAGCGWPPAHEGRGSSQVRVAACHQPPAPLPGQIGLSALPTGPLAQHPGAVSFFRNQSWKS